MLDVLRSDAVVEGLEATDEVSLRAITWQGSALTRLGLAPHDNRKALCARQVDIDFRVPLCYIAPSIPWHSRPSVLTTPSDVRAHSPATRPASVAAMMPRHREGTEWHRSVVCHDERSCTPAWA